MGNGNRRQTIDAVGKAELPDLSICMINDQIRTIFLIIRMIITSIRTINYEICMILLNELNKRTNSTLELVLLLLPVIFFFFLDPYHCTFFESFCLLLCWLFLLHGQEFRLALLSQLIV